MKYIEKEYKTQESTSEIDEKVKIMRKMMGGISKDVTKRPIIMEDIIIDGYKEKIKVRIYRPKEEENKLPYLLHFHGGAWVGGSLWAVEEYCKALSDRGNIVVISVEYHLAPEFKFPCGLMDCYNALEWAWDNADKLNITKEECSVCGDSAGGNFAAAISLIARDKEKIKIKNQILIYPAVLMNEDGIANPDINNTDKSFGKMVMDLYLGETKEWNNPYVSPIKAKDFSNLPRTLTIVCEFDGLKKEGKEFAEKLSDAGVESKLILFKNSHHAFLDYTGYCKQVDDLIDEMIEFI